MSTRLERIFFMDALISSGSYPSVKTFTERFEVSERTIYDDIRFLKDRLNAPLKYSHSHSGYSYTDPNWKLSFLPTTTGDLLAFFLSVELAHRYLGTSFEEPLHNAIQRLTNLLPDTIQVSIGELASHYSVRSGATAKTPSETLLALQEAIQARQPVNMVYFTAQRGQETQRVVHPYHLFNMHGEWYLIAYDRFRQEVRQFALPRIRSWQVLEDEHFEIDPTFSPEQYFEESFQSEHGSSIVEVILLFDAYQARYIRERPWHTSQKIEEQPNGEIIMRFKTGALSEVQRWIMSYGSHVRVLAPKSLAQAIAEEFREWLMQYEEI